MTLRTAGRQEDPKFKTALELLHAQQRLPAVSPEHVQGASSGVPQPAFNVAGSGSPLGAASLQPLGGRAEGGQLGNGPTRLGGSPERREYVQGYDNPLQQRHNPTSSDSRQMLDALRRRAAQVAQTAGQGQFQQVMGQQVLGQQAHLLRQNQGQLPPDGYNLGKGWGQGSSESELLEQQKVEQQEAARKMLLHKQGAGGEEQGGGVVPAHLVSQFQKLLAVKQQQQKMRQQEQHAYSVQRELEHRQAQRYETQKLNIDQQQMHLLKQQLQDQGRKLNGPSVQMPAQAPFKLTPTREAALGALSNAALQQALKSRPAPQVAPVKVEPRNQLPATSGGSRPGTPPDTAKEEHPSKKFTKGQLDTLKAQILAFRRFKVRDHRTLIHTLLRGPFAVLLRYS